MPSIHIANTELRLCSEPGASFFFLVETGIEGAEEGVEDPVCIVIVVAAVKVCAVTVVPAIVVAATVVPDTVFACIVVAFTLVPSIVVGPRIVVTTTPKALAGMAVPTPELVHWEGMMRVAVFGFDPVLPEYMLLRAPLAAVRSPVIRLTWSPDFAV
jgi:hypothetical protein